MIFWACGSPHLRRVFKDAKFFAFLEGAGPATTLVWQRAAAPDRLTWADAGPYCASLAGFRLPGAKELLSLVDWQAHDVAIDGSAFPGTPAGAFWTSSRMAGSTADAVTVDFSQSVYAGTSHAAASSPQYVRCVR
jgi:hypothetical protein